MLVEEFHGLRYIFGNLGNFLAADGFCRRYPLHSRIRSEENLPRDVACGIDAVNIRPVAVVDDNRTGIVKSNPFNVFRPRSETRCDNNGIAGYLLAVFAAFKNGGCHKTFRIRTFLRFEFLHESILTYRDRGNLFSCAFNQPFGLIAQESAAA